MAIDNGVGELHLGAKHLGQHFLLHFAYLGVRGRQFMVGAVVFMKDDGVLPFGDIGHNAPIIEQLRKDADAFLQSQPAHLMFVLRGQPLPYAVQQPMHNLGPLLQEQLVVEGQGQVLAFASEEMPGIVGERVHAPGPPASLGWRRGSRHQSIGNEILELLTDGGVADSERLAQFFNAHRAIALEQFDNLSPRGIVKAMV